MHLIRIVGARPQFMQAAPLRRAIEARGHKETLIHTGQHYDANMSDIFFTQLQIPKPDIRFSIDAQSQAEQTAQMLSNIGAALPQLKADAVIIDGDTNSTLAGALAAAKLHIPLIHVEAGLRSYNRKMPEEINRIVADHTSDVLCAPTRQAIKNLEKEGLSTKATITGDLMYDCFLHFSKHAKNDILNELNIEPKNYLLATIHRAENADSIENLTSILKALNQLHQKVILPLHPRTRNTLASASHNYDSLYPNINFLEPVGYLEMITLISSAHCILTDSGGLQREAYFANVPSLILRDETEWVEQVEAGWSLVAGVEQKNIITQYETLLQMSRKAGNIYGDGNAADKIVTAIEALNTRM